MVEIWHKKRSGSQCYGLVSCIIWSWLNVNPRLLIPYYPVEKIRNTATQAYIFSNDSVIITGILGRSVTDLHLHDSTANLHDMQIRHTSTSPPNRVVGWLLHCETFGIWDYILIQLVLNTPNTQKKLQYTRDLVWAVGMIQWRRLNRETCKGL